MSDQISWLTIFGAVTGGIGTSISIYLLARQILVERTKLFIYITKWETVLENDGYLVTKARLAIENQSRIDNSVRRILLKSREEKNFAFEPTEWEQITSDNQAWIDFNDKGNIESVCPNNEAISLPLNISSRSSVSGWLGFSMKPEYVDKAKKYHWCLKIVDQDGKKYISPKEQDQNYT